MEEKVDLGRILRDWPYDPENDVRLVRGQDGRHLLQVRLPLGIEQYELEGRPDGERPHGKESSLQYHCDRLAAAERSGTDGAFTLTPDDCAELFTEGTLYYYRYLHLFQVRDWASTVRDTARNLRLFDFVHRYAQHPEDQLYLEQWRPYVLRMNATATAMMRLDEGNHQEALAVVQQAITTIQALDELDDDTFQFERDRSLAALKDMSRQIEENQPVSEVELLERELRHAIETQHFERAADLRDRIRALRDEPKKHS